MQGFRGLKRCKRCGDYDVFGWHGRWDGSESFRNFEIVGFSAVKVPSVFAPYAADSGSLDEGQTPGDSTWLVGLSAANPYHPQGGAQAIICCNGARVIYDTNGHNYVMYLASNDDAGGVDFGWPEDEFTGISSFHVIDLKEDAPTAQSYWAPLDFNAWGVSSDRFNVAANSLRGGPQIDTRLVGCSRDSYVVVHNNALVGAFGWAGRFKFSTGEWCAGVRHNDGDRYVTLPAQAAEGGNAWVLAFGRSQGMWTGIWTNTLGDTSGTSPTGALAILTPEECVNDLSAKPGYPAIAIHVINPLAYTRRNGFDYVVIDSFNEDLPLGEQTVYHYYDGRRGSWFPLGNYAPTNIYAFENGDIALANYKQVIYLNADGSERWNWNGPGIGIGLPSENTGAGHWRLAVSLSGNGKWLQLQNIVTLGNAAPDTIMRSDEASPNPWTISSVDIENIENTPAVTRWVPLGPSNAQAAIGLSREIRQPGGKPTVVVHRILDEVDEIIDEGLGTEHLQSFPAYRANLYVSSETRDDDWGAAFYRSQSIGHLQLWGNAGSGCGPRGFDIVPCCKCSCSPSDKTSW